MIHNLVKKRKIENVPKVFLSNIPGINFLYRIWVSRNFLAKETGGTVSARYCYSVWLRHLVMAEKGGLPTQPKVIAELGPGDSLGIGLCGLLTGAEQYYAFDVVEYSKNENNHAILADLINLFKRQESIPGENEFPTVKPYLDSYEFPDHILTEERLTEALDIDRIALIREALMNINKEISQEIHISYIVPWNDRSTINNSTVDMVFSQAVMEHVEDLDWTYEAIYRWLKPNGYLSHQIDFRSHGTAKQWNGHWGYSDFQWNLLKGKRTWLINREPLSTHLRIVESKLFELCTIKRVENTLGLRRHQLAIRYKKMSDEDLHTSGAFIQAKKTPLE